jgi:drug/metabolite transporter (DMT)-like permease
MSSYSTIGRGMSSPRVAALTIAALFGFAANSLLCRAAIGAREIDPATFTAVRLLAGALVLAVLARIASATSTSATSTSATSTSATSTSATPASATPASATSTSATSTSATSANALAANAAARGSWISALALFVYAAAFSFAYVRLTTATGALLLFASVQLSMVGAGVARGERPRAIEWLGHAIAIGGLVALASPGLEAPDAVGAVLMAIAGVAWGVYSLRGRGAKNPLAITADNFARTVPMAFALLVVTTAIGLLLVDTPSIAHDAASTGSSSTAHHPPGALIYTSSVGVLLAIASGAIASGVGYTLWYTALPHLPATRAAVVQLSVPAIAAAGGMIILAEAMTARFAVCAAAILGGVALAIVRRHPSTRSPTASSSPRP